MQCSVCSMFCGKSNPSVMPVGGICSHWPPFSRKQVSQPVRQTDNRSTMSNVSKGISSCQRQESKQNYTFCLPYVWGVDFLGSNLFGEGEGFDMQTIMTQACKLEAAVGWMQMMPFSMEQVVRYHSFWATGLVFSILELAWDLLWTGPGYISYIVWLLTTCAVAACKRWIRITNQIWSNDKRFVLESWSFLLIASHVSRFKSIPSLT